jgi:hypothetical protein
VKAPDASAGAGFRTRALLPGRGVGVDAVGTRAGVDDSAEPRGKAGADAVVVGSKCRIGLIHAAETDLHLPGEGKVRSKNFAVPLGELIRFWAARCDAGVHRIPEGTVEAGNGVGVRCARNAPGTSAVESSKMARILSRPRPISR